MYIYVTQYIRHTTFHIVWILYHINTCPFLLYQSYIYLPILLDLRMYIYSLQAVLNVIAVPTSGISSTLYYYFYYTNFKTVMFAQQVNNIQSKVPSHNINTEGLTWRENSSNQYKFKYITWHIKSKQ